jgi:hypothetical protein
MEPSSACGWQGLKRERREALPYDSAPLPATNGFGVGGANRALCGRPASTTTDPISGSPMVGQFSHPAAALVEDPSLRDRTRRQAGNMGSPACEKFMTHEITRGIERVRREGKP